MNLKSGKASKSPASGGGARAHAFGERAYVTSVERALTILELLAERRDGLTAADLSRRARIPKSTLSYILRTLVRRGYVRRNADGGLHTLGLRLLSLSGQAMQGMELREAAMPYLRHISERTRLDAHLAILDHGDAVYVGRVEALGFIKMATWIGRRMTPHVTAVGKALICQLEREEVQEIFKQHQVKPATPKTITTLSRLLADLALTRQRGYAVDDEESEARVRCVAAPVVAANGEVVAAIGVSGTVGQIGDRDIARIGNLVRVAALRLSAQIGGRR
jgi:DNA-binding IclR family transcriptional regulator